MKIIRLTEPEVEPITLDEAKAHLRVDYTDEDDLIQALISAARARVEDYCSRAFVAADFAILYDGDLPRGDSVLEVPLAGVTSVTSISYTDIDGASVDWGSSNWDFDAERQILTADAWPSGKNLRIEVSAGDASSAPVIPPAVRYAIKLFLAGMFELRQDQITGETIAENPAAVSLMQPYRQRMGI